MVSTHLKNISQNGNLPQNRGEHKRYLKPPPRIYSSNDDVHGDFEGLRACPPSRITRPGGWKPTCSAPFETTEIQCRFLSDFSQPKSSRLGIAHSPQHKKQKKNKRPAYKGRQTACVTKPLGRRGGKSMRCFEFPLPTIFGGKLQQQTSHNSKRIGSKNWGFLFFEVQLF